MSCPALYNGSQVRTLSEFAYHTEMSIALSEEILKRVRSACISLFEHIRQDPNLTDPVVIPIASDQLELIFRDAIKELEKNNLLFVDHKYLLQSVVKAIKHYYEKKKIVRVPRNEVMRIPHFSSDDRLLKWMNGAQMRTIMHLEEQNKLRSIEIPENDREFSCYRYALTSIGVEIDGALDQEKLFEIIFSGNFKVVREPQKGDLVLFLKDNAPTHLAVWQGNGYVLSKEGNLCPVAYLKRLEDFPPQYGNKILCLNRMR